MAEKYKLIFGVSISEGFISSPYIVVPKVKSGSSNQELANFLESLDIVNIERIENKIGQKLEQEPYLEDMVLIGITHIDYIRLKWREHKSVVILNLIGISVIIPLRDFILLLAEWKKFLLNVSKSY